MSESEEHDRETDSHKTNLQADVANLLDQRQALKHETRFLSDQARAEQNRLIAIRDAVES